MSSAMHSRRSSRSVCAAAWELGSFRLPSRLIRADRGMVTAETAVVLPVLVLLLTLLLATLSHAVDYVRVIDAARSAARLAARGESLSTVEQQALAEAPEGSSVDLDTSGDQVRVTVTAPERRLLGPIALPSAGAEAVALLESSIGP